MAPHQLVRAPMLLALALTGACGGEDEAMWTQCPSGEQMSSALDGMSCSFATGCQVNYDFWPEPVPGNPDRRICGPRITSCNAGRLHFTDGTSPCVPFGADAGPGDAGATVTHDGGQTDAGSLDAGRVWTECPVVESEISPALEGMPCSFSKGCSGNYDFWPEPTPENPERRICGERSISCEAGRIRYIDSTYECVLSLSDAGPGDAGEIFDAAAADD